MKIFFIVSTLFVFCNLGNSIISPHLLQSRVALALNWSYEGSTNPENWGQFAPICSQGQNQSPINITTTKSQDLTNIDFNYQPSKIKILNNGRTVQVNYDSGSYLEVDGKTYNVKQFHYHSPSEHSINGRSFPAELHIVHEQDGKYAVVAILLTSGEAENLGYKPFIDRLPLQKSPEITINTTINAGELLPTNQTTYRYHGSLTTPPCTEEVSWFLMTTPVKLSEAQIATLQTAFQGNNRPVQSLGIRRVILDSTP